MSKPKRIPCRLKPDEIRRLAAERGFADMKTLAEISGLKYRSFMHWLNESRTPDIDSVQRLAMGLGVGLEDIAFPPAEALMLPEPDADPAYANDGPTLTRIFRNLARPFAWYGRYIGVTWWPIRGHVQHFEHTARRRHYYSELTVRPTRWPMSADSQKFILSFQGGPLRFDYGQLTLTREGAVLLRAVFQEQRAQAKCGTDGTFRIWNWFGRERCSFIIRSAEPFDLVTDLESKGRDPTRSIPEDTVCFLAARHHLEAADEEAARQTRAPSQRGRR